MDHPHQLPAMGTGDLRQQIVDYLGQDAQPIMQAVYGGNLIELTDQQQRLLIEALCTVTGLNPITRPFELLRASVKRQDDQGEYWEDVMVLYAKKDCADQIRARLGLSTTILAKEAIGNVYLVTVRVSAPNGRSEEDIGATSWSPDGGWKFAGKNAKAIMHALTKAKRRATLGMFGLGILDQSEVEDMRANGDLVPVSAAKPAEPDPAKAAAASTAPVPASPPEPVTQANPKAARASARSRVPQGYQPPENVEIYVSRVCNRALEVGGAFQAARQALEDRLHGMPLDYALDCLERTERRHLNGHAHA